MFFVVLPLFIFFKYTSFWGNNELSKAVVKYEKSLRSNFSQSLSDGNIEDLSQRTGFVQRNSKLTARHFLEMCMFGNLSGSPASLNDFSAYLMEEHQVQISKQGIDERFNSLAVDFLKSLLTEEMSHKLDLSTLQSFSSPFSRIRVKDSTRWNLPDHYSDKYKGLGGYRAKSKSMVSVQFEYNLLSGDIMDLSMTSGTRNDQQDSKEIKNNIEANDLLIRDLAYATLGYMKNVADKKAYFLNRMSPQVAVYEAENQKPLDFKVIKHQLGKSNLSCMEQNVLIGTIERFPCRMIVTRVPNDVYRKRVQKAEKEAKARGLQVTDAYKARAALNIFLTNAPASLLKAKNITAIYRIRWQIELMFKVWKSLGKVSSAWEMKMARFECQLIAKFIWLTINWKIFFAINHWVRQLNAEQMCSIWKFYKQVMRMSLELRDILWEDGDLQRWLIKLFSKAHRNLLIEKKKGKNASYEYFNMLIDLA